MNMRKNTPFHNARNTSKYSSKVQLFTFKVHMLKKNHHYIINIRNKDKKTNNPLAIIVTSW